MGYLDKKGISLLDSQFGTLDNKEKLEGLGEWTVAVHKFGCRE
jgi:hypothetical protein